MPVIRFNSKQLNRISEIFGNLGLLLLASMSIPVFSGDRKFDLLIFAAGIFGFIICSFESISLIGGERNE